MYVCECVNSIVLFNYMSACFYSCTMYVYVHLHVLVFHLNVNMSQHLLCVNSIVKIYVSHTLSLRSEHLARGVNVLTCIYARTFICDFNKTNTCLQKDLRTSHCVSKYFCLYIFNFKYLYVCVCVLVCLSVCISIKDKVCLNITVVSFLFVIFTLKQLR